jgi:hypothetical protein
MPLPKVRRKRILGFSQDDLRKQFNAIAYGLSYSEVNGMIVWHPPVITQPHGTHQRCGGGRRVIKKKLGNN